MKYLDMDFSDCPYGFKFLFQEIHQNLKKDIKGCVLIRVRDFPQKHSFINKLHNNLLRLDPEGEIYDRMYYIWDKYSDVVALRTIMKMDMPEHFEFRSSEREFDYNYFGYNNGRREFPIVICHHNDFEKVEKAQNFFAQEFYKSTIVHFTS